MNHIDKILSLSKPTAKEISQSIADRVKSRRLELSLTQVGLCNKAGVNLASYRRFERTGLISLEALIKIAIAMNMEDDFDQLFSNKIYLSIDDVINEKNPRKRGSRNE